MSLLLQVSAFAGDLGASLVQLNSEDCLWKLGGDLLHLFVYQPTADLSCPVSSLETLYQECYSRKLVPATYSAKSIQQVLKAKHLKTVIQVCVSVYVIGIRWEGGVWLGEGLMVKYQNCVSIPQGALIFVILAPSCCAVDLMCDLRYFGMIDHFLFFFCVLKVDKKTHACSPCQPYKQQVLASLLTELIFLRGEEETHLDSLLRLYLSHFQVPLLLHGYEVNNVADLLKLPRVRQCIDCVPKAVSCAAMTTGQLANQLAYLAM